MPAAAPAIPTEWINPVPPGAASAASQARWWQRFADPTLSALVQQALDHNTDLRKAAAAMRQARALQDRAVAAQGAAFGVAGSVQRVRSGGLPSRQLIQADFSASWEADLFGGLAAASQAAGFDAEAAALQLRATRIAVAGDVAASYLTLRGNQARRHIAAANLASQLGTLQISQWRAQAGLGTSLDVEQARSAAEQTRAQIPDLDAAISNGAHALAVLTGQAPGELMTLVADESNATASPAAAGKPGARSPGVIPDPDDPVPALPADVLRQRPDVRAAESQLRAAAARWRQADAARWPDLSLSGSLGASAATLESLARSGALLTSLIGRFSATLFDGGALAAQAQAQHEAWDQAAAAYHAALLAALKDVEDARAQLAGARQRLTTLTVAAQAAANADLLARQRYRSGLVDFQVVLNTQRNLLAMQDGTATAATDVALGQVRLYRVLGGADAGPGDADAPQPPTDSRS